jgi:hypothetical protein
LRNININVRKNEYKKEREYFKRKWAPLVLEINQCTGKFYFKKYSLEFFQFICRVIFKIGVPSFLAKGIKKIMINLYDYFLGKSIFFGVKEYGHTGDFYLAQKLPKEIIQKYDYQQNTI